MSRARSAGFALGVAALAAPAGSASADPPCIPSAAISGDPALVATVTRALYERGLSLSETSACGTVRAEVAPEDERVRVRITDADGRTVERVADDGEGAATAIESWTRQDLAAPLLAARLAPAPAPRAPRAEARTAEVVTRPPASRGSGGWALAALGVAAVSDDGAFWSGARAEVSARVAWLSLGGRVGLALDTGTTGVTATRCVHRAEDYFESEAGCDTARTIFDLVLTASVPFTVGRLELTPGLGIGQRTLWASRGVGDADEREADSTALLLQAHVAVGVRLGRHWLARLDLSGAATPNATTRLGSLDPPEHADWVPSLAGVPIAQGLVAIGLAYAPAGGP